MSITAVMFLTCAGSAELLPELISIAEHSWDARAARYAPVFDASQLVRLRRADTANADKGGSAWRGAADRRGPEGLSKRVGRRRVGHSCQDLRCQESGWAVHVVGSEAPRVSVDVSRAISGQALQRFYPAGGGTRTPSSCLRRA